MRKLTALALTVGLALATVACSDDDDDPSADSTDPTGGAAEIPDGTVAPEHVEFCDAYRAAAESLRDASEASAPLDELKTEYQAAIDVAPEDVVVAMEEVSDILEEADTAGDLFLMSVDAEESSEAINEWVIEHCLYDPTTLARS